MSARRERILEAAISVIARHGVRGMRVQEVAAEAEVSVTLLYHYFGSRSGLLEHALGAVSEHAARYSLDEAAAPGRSARQELEIRLMAELQDTTEVETTSRAWGELRWASVFDESLRPTVARLTDEWVEDIAGLIARVREEEGHPDPGADTAPAAERLVALVEGLSGRWLTGAAPLAHLRQLLSGGIARELA